MQFRSGVRVWFSSESVLRLVPCVEPGGSMTVTEMYFKYCAPSVSKRVCEECQVETDQESQSRVFTAPNILVVQMVRS